MSGYMLFAGNYYYPDGGFSDFVGTFATVAEAKDALDPTFDWAQLVDEYLEIELELVRKGDQWIEPYDGWMNPE